MPAPGVNLSATLVSILAEAVELGTVDVQLCGYGKDVPRIAATAIFADTVPVGLVPDANGIVTTTVWNNAAITPMNTYYMVTVKDANGDVIQVAAYRFAADGSFNLSNLNPIDPDFQTPPTPTPTPIPEDLIVYVAFEVDALFDGALGDTFEMTLLADSAIRLANMEPGKAYWFIWIQNVNPTTITFPANMINATQPSATNGSVNTQEFICGSDGKLRPASQAIYS